MLIGQRVLEQRMVDESLAIYIVEELFGAPLYGVYVIAIEVYNDDEIQGTLMTQPFDISGPFTTFQEAVNYVQTLNEGGTNLDNSSDAT